MRGIGTFKMDAIICRVPASAHPPRPFQWDSDPTSIGPDQSGRLRIRTYAVEIVSHRKLALFAGEAPTPPTQETKSF